MKRFKKQFLAASLILALGAAVYLNWTMSSNTQTVSKTLGESKFVNATVSTVEETESTAKQSGTALTDKQKSFFAEAKTKRGKIQDKVIDTANETLNMENVSESELSQAQSQIAGMLKNFTLQDTIESELKAKGFSEALCYITDSGCTVSVPEKELSDESAVIIKAAVKSAAGVSFDKITIVAV